ncbi:MAG: DJ-1/PfpI family protein, partial [Phycisphaerales bacterium]
ILVFNDVEVLDFCGPFEVFSVTRLHEEARGVDPSPFEVLLIAEETGPIVTTGGMKVSPQNSFENCPALDILVVPGGRGVREELKNTAMLEWVRTRAAEVQTLTAVCTGSILLAQAGALDGLHATTHWQALHWMRETFPAVTVEDDKHVVTDGRVYTSAGISAGIDMSLAVVEHYFGESIAKATARQMEYPYPQPNQRRIEI